MNRAHRVSPIHYLVPLAAGLAIASFAAGQSEAAAAVETAYLAVLVTAVLLPLAALAVRPDLELGLPAVLATAAAWVVPAGPTRGAAITLLLLFALGTATARRQIRDGSRLAWSVAVAVALALQLLIRSERLLNPGLDGATLVGLLALPVAAAAAVVVLARDRDPWLVLVAAAAALVLVPGFSVSVTLSLVLLAAVDLTRDRGRSRLAWTCTVLIAGVAFYWEPALGVLLVAVAAAHRAAGSFKASAAVAVAAVAAAALMPAARGAEQCLHQLALLPLLLPAGLFALRDRWTRLVLAAVLAAVGLRIVPDPGALAAPIALLALALRPEGAPWELQRLWSGLLVGGTTLLATYPWMRQRPLTDGLECLGLAPGWPSALGVVAAVVILGASWELLARRYPERRFSPIAAALVLLGLAAYASLPPVAVRPLGERPEVLGGERQRIELELPQGTRVAELVVDSYLSDAAALPAGTPVADLHLTGADGTRRTWTLKAGIDTGEWAARREDVASLPGFVAPAPWLSRVASEGDLFAQRYRGRKKLEVPIRADRLEISRRQTLPAAVSIAIFHLELRP